MLEEPVARQAGVIYFRRFAKKWWVSSTEVHRRYMSIALREAALAHGYTSPNPMVGAVVVRGGRIIAQAHHRRSGGPHAEVAALSQVPGQTRGADLYVTLEPCNHIGRTGPCADAVIAAGLARVIVGHEDPNLRVSGGGLAKLRQAGIEVISGILADEARCLNEAWVYSVQHQRPWVVVKIATSLDGRVATRTGDSQWITGSEARAVGHRLRGECDAIVVGIGTVLADDPRLTCRTGGPDPLRVVLDSGARLAEQARLLNTDSPAATLCCIADSIAAAESERLTRAGAEVVRLPRRKAAEGGVILQGVLEELHRRSIVSVLVEGGPRVLGAFFDAGLVNKVHAFVAPLIIGGVAAPCAVAGAGPAALDDALRLERVVMEKAGDDMHVAGYPAG